MDRFIHTQNLARFMGLLEAETDALQRERLQDLLVEEENRFGSRRERVMEADGLIARGEARLREQELLVARLSDDGRDTAAAERLLANMIQTLQAFVAYRKGLAAGTVGDLG